MATLISIATGNFTTAGTWALADATAEQDSEANNTATTTSPVASSTFAPGAVTVNAIGIKVGSRASTGTFTVELFNSTLASSVASITTNVTDLPSNGGWCMFPIGSQLLLVANSYSIRVSSSTAGTVTLYRNATANNWTRQLRTTTTQAPAVGDKLIVVGENTGIGTGNSFTVTMNNTATTSFGAVAFPQSLSINSRATLAYGVAASTAYYLKIKGIVKVWTGGTFTIGTSGSPIPSTSTAVLEFDATANVDSGLEVGELCTFTTFGSVLTFDRTKLAADAAAAATSLTTTDSTGWLSADSIALASTTRTPGESEKKSLTANAVGTALTIAALTNAHSGTNGGTGNDTRGELGNLTRNVKIRGVSSALHGYINYSFFSITSSNWTEFSDLGSSTAGKLGINLASIGTTCVFNHCSFHDFDFSGSSTIRLTGNTDLISIQNSILYNMGIFYNVDATAGVNVFNNNLCIKSTGVGLHLADVGGTVTNNTIAGAGSFGIQFDEAGAVIGTFTGNIVHSCGNAGLEWNVTTSSGTISGGKYWRNGTAGIWAPVALTTITFDTIELFGNQTTNIRLDATCLNCIFNAITSNAGVTLTTPTGFTINSTMPGSIISNSSFGASQAHTQDILLGANATTAQFANTLFSSSTEFSGQSSMLPGSIIGIQAFDQVIGNNKTLKREGTISLDTVIFNTASPSARLTPSLASEKLFDFITEFAVNSGSTLTPSVKVRKSVVGDGTAYNGNQPRLIVLANVTAGIASNTVLATASGAAGSWETLTGTTISVTDNTTLSFIVDCDGTTGWINVDDLLVVCPDSSGFKYWKNGQPVITGFTDVSGIYTDPGIANVRSGVSYKFNSATNNRTGNVVLPSAATVLSGITYDTLSSVTGTFLVPTAAQVASAVWDENLTTHNTANSAGKIVQDAAQDARTAKNMIIGKS